MTLKKILFILIIQLASFIISQFTFQNSSFAITYYLSTSGNDDNDGMTPSTPWASINKINSFVFSPGDVISFKAGEKFIGSVNQLIDYNNPDEYLTFNSYGNGKAILECQDTSSYCFKVEFTKRIAISISDLVIQGKYNAKLQNGGKKTSGGIYIFTHNSLNSENNVSNILVKNCEISNFANGGINIVCGDFARVINATIDSNIIHDCGNCGIALNYLWYSASVIKNNVIYDIYGMKKNALQYSGIGIQIILCKKVICERNLIYNMGKYAIISGLGIITGASKNIIVRYNEIYNVYNNKGFDGEGIDFENGSDSCIAEYNYLHNLEGVGVLISGSSKKSVMDCNIKNMANMDYSCADYNVIRYNIFKECGTEDFLMSVKIGSGKRKFPATNNLIYNNTIVKQNTGENYAIVLTFPQKGTGIFNNIILTKMVAFMLVDRMDTKINLSVSNNCFYDISEYREIIVNKNNDFDLYLTEEWIDDFNLNKKPGTKSSLNVNPMLKKPFTSSDFVKNAFMIDTMSAYKLTDGSPMIDNGIDLKAMFGIDPGSFDFYGNAVGVNGKYDIGAYEFSK